MYTLSIDEAADVSGAKSRYGVVGELLWSWAGNKLLDAGWDYLRDMNQGGTPNGTDPLGNNW